jgi:hypothetical protein
MCRELEEDRANSDTYYRRHNGKLFLGPSAPMYNDPEYLAEREGLPFVAPFQIGKKFYRMLLRQTARLGLEVQYGQRAERYFEDEACGLGGVVTQDGSVHMADIVIAADGHKSTSEMLIARESMLTRSSGMSVYRAAFPTELALRNEAFSGLWVDVVKKETSRPIPVT